MSKDLNYLKGGIYRLRQNKAYALFCVLGTAFTFVFIIIILQLAYTLTSNVPPFVNADRTLEVSWIKDSKGEYFYIMPNESLDFLKRIPGAEDYYIYDNSSDDVTVNGNYQGVSMLFVSAGYWRVNQFNFLCGRAFTENDCENKNPVVVVTKEMANEFFNRTDVLGEKIEVQGNMYTIIGVVDDFSSFVRQGYDIWLPYLFDQFIPNGAVHYNLALLTPEGVGVKEMKQRFVQAVYSYWKERNEEVCLNFDDIPTQQENQIRRLGMNVLHYGLPLAILLLLLIPAINIVALNMANVSNYANDVALRRALGASKFSAFVHVIRDNVLLVFLGVILGLLLVSLIVELTRDGLNLRLIRNIDCEIVVLGVFPLLVLFALLSGGMPAYLVAKSNVAKTLKGEMEVSKTTRGKLFGIGIEQALIFGILMISVVSLAEAVKQYREPGLVNPKDRLIVLYMLNKMGQGMSLEEMSENRDNIDVLIMNLKTNSLVNNVMENFDVIPYLRGDEYYHSDTVWGGMKAVKAFIKEGDSETLNVLEFKLEEGKWWNDDVLENGTYPAVATRQLIDKFDWYEGVGKEVVTQGNKFTIVGVIDGLKHNVFGELYPALIIPFSVNGGAALDFREFCIHVKPKSMKEVMSFIHREAERLGIDKKGQLFCVPLEKLKSNNMSGKIYGLVMQSVPTVFLVFFAFIGTFGLFWLTAKRRRREFALRMVMGCTRRGLARLVVGESLCVTGLAMVPGLLLSFFIYDWTATQALAIGLTVLLMLLFSVFSAWWPARQVSRLRPADVLREE